MRGNIRIVVKKILLLSKARFLDGLFFTVLA